MIGDDGVGVWSPSLHSENLTVLAESGDIGSEDCTGVFNRKTKGHGLSPERRGFVENDFGMGSVSTLERGSTAMGKETWDEVADEDEEYGDISGKASNMDA